MEAIGRWGAREWSVAAVASVLTALAIGLPTDVIPNPVFGRPTTPVTWWSYPVLVVTAVLGGLLAATYVRPSPVTDGGATDQTEIEEFDRPARAGGLGGLLSFFAVGCPTCNKLVIVAVGSTGALDWFAPAQPVLAVLSVGLLGWALHARLTAADECRLPELPSDQPPQGNMAG